MFFAQANSVVKAHPIHVSVVNIDLLDDGGLKFSVKLFVDDFQTVINKTYGANFVFDAKLQQTQAQKEIVAYVYNHLKFGETPKSNYQLTKTKIDETSIWLYFELKMNYKKQTEIKLYNCLMCDLFDDQTNLLIFNIKGKDVAYRYTNKDTIKVFDLVQP
jgi:hypothetical protein